MKLICLNVWAGKLFDPLEKYVKRESATTDIFCFQEVMDGVGSAALSHGERPDTYRMLCAALPDFLPVFIPVQHGWSFKERSSPELAYGQAIFVRKGIDILETGDVMLYLDKDTFEGIDNTMPRNMIWVRIAKEGKKRLVLNVHGLIENTATEKFPKINSPARTAQTARIKSFLLDHPAPTILCGDFNARPETQCIRTLEDGMENLTKSFRVPTTRNDHYPDGKKYKDLWGDYLFVTPDIDIVDFQVPGEEVSDHLPLVLEFH